MVNQLPDVDLRHYIDVKDNQLFTPSTRIAEVFGKEHRNVLRAIRALDCSEYFNALNFERVTYKDAKGEKREMYNITKDGFVFLVMGFTGKQAAAIKEAYINAFNAMAGQLQQLPSADMSTGLQQANTELQQELLQLYREKATYLQQELTQKQRPAPASLKNNPFTEHKKHTFIHTVIQFLHENPGATKTKVLEASGVRKDDKTARNWLVEYEGIHWDCVAMGTAYAYFCKEYRK